MGAAIESLNLSSKLEVWVVCNTWCGESFLYTIYTSDGTIMIEVLVGSVAVSVLFSVVDEELVDVLGVEVALELDRLHLLVAINENGWSSLDIFALSVLANDVPACLEGNINVSELDFLILDGLNGSQFLPLNREFLALAASGVNIGDHPDILNVFNDYLLESLLLNSVRFRPEPIVFVLVTKSVSALLRDRNLVDGAWSKATIALV